MRLLVTGGGTGGHVYPALAVIEALRNGAAPSAPLEAVAWVGQRDSIEERIVTRGDAGAGPMAFHAIDAGALRGANPLKAAHSVLRLMRGYRQAQRLVASFRPEVVFATGGYVSVPLVLAARRGGCRVLIYLPDMEPGLAVRWLSRQADRVAVSFDAVRRHLPGVEVVVTGYPVRRALFETTREAARRALALPLEGEVLLVFGGSRGARTINRATRGALQALLERVYVVHVTGHQDYAEAEAVRQSLTPALRERYHPYAYLHDRMTDALVASDLVVARAGAATLGEFPAVGLPAVLVPYPYAGQHQHVNADHLARRGAAVVVEDADLEVRLLPTVRALLDDPPRLRAMAAAAKAASVPGAAAAIAQHLEELAGSRARDAA
ncbi:MAG TPA: undecaprenyldiphospho-muramoylpentapeptide beta-N-acetylglucosaminyltransferase [Chloroflexi bacterium]|jgi:UDP-N-acetylglucosamine--N-acetylmuramyl-(pentapeptide) pyrophosphoryl-undecaprenol N-acetylglucosamine transferase|nr:undecaprenyldiphospho-muramoylpentapeptide beta-N-acetylglucosaminyltransferase [Chloroflexota bacterium]